VSRSNEVGHPRLTPQAYDSLAFDAGKEKTIAGVTGALEA